MSEWKRVPGDNPYRRLVVEFVRAAVLLDPVLHLDLVALLQSGEQTRATAPPQPVPNRTEPAVRDEGSTSSAANTSAATPAFEPPPRAAVNTSNIPNALSQLAGDLKKVGVEVDLVTLATWGDTKWDVARAWLDEGAKPEDRPAWMPPEYHEATSGGDRAKLVARAYDEGLLTDDTLDVDEAWIQLNRIAPAGWFSSQKPSESEPSEPKPLPEPKPPEPEPKKPVDLLGLLRSNVAAAKNAKELEAKAAGAPPPEKKKRGRPRKEPDPKEAAPKEVKEGENSQIDWLSGL